MSSGPFLQPYETSRNWYVEETIRIDTSRYDAYRHHRGHVTIDIYVPRVIRISEITKYIESFPIAEPKPFQ